VNGNDPVAVVGASGNDAFNYYPAYSPDAQWIAFTSHNNMETYTDPQARIYTVASDDPNASPIEIAANRDENGSYFPGATNSYPSWSPDGRYLTFNSKRNDTSNFDVLWAEVGSDGNTGLATPLAGADDENVFELMSAWGSPLDRFNPLARLGEVLPFLLPLIPLAALAWFFCNRGKQSGIDIPEPPIGEIPLVNPEPLPPKAEPFNIKWETQPAMIIGLGRTGRWVITHLKKSLLDAGEEEIPDNIRLLVVDTGDYEQLNQAHQKNPISIAGVTLDNQTEVIELKDNLNELLKQDLTNRREYQDWVDIGRLRTINTGQKLFKIITVFA
jgi:hypothetical protein